MFELARLKFKSEQLLTLNYQRFPEPFLIIGPNYYNGLYKLEPKSFTIDPHHNSFSFNGLLFFCKLQIDEERFKYQLIR